MSSVCNTILTFLWVMLGYSQKVSVWNISMSTLVSVSQASELLQISPQQVRLLCRSGKLPSAKVGNAWVVDAESQEFRLMLPHRDTRPESIARRSSDKPIALSFFSGAMGLDLG